MRLVIKLICSLNENMYVCVCVGHPSLVKKYVFAASTFTITLMSQSKCAWINTIQCSIELTCTLQTNSYYPCPFAMIAIAIFICLYSYAPKFHFEGLIRLIAWVQCSAQWTSLVSIDVYRTFCQQRCNKWHQITLLDSRNWKNCSKLNIWIYNTSHWTECSGYLFTTKIVNWNEVSQTCIAHHLIGLITEMCLVIWNHQNARNY